MNTNPFQEALHHRNARRTEYIAQAKQVFEQAGLIYTSTEDDEVFLLREIEGLSIDCYAGDRRWQWVESGKALRGGVTVFLKWYLSMRARED